MNQVLDDMLRMYIIDQHQVLDDMLRMYIMDQPKWKEYLALVEFAYNNSHHSITWNGTF